MPILPLIKDHPRLAFTGAALCFLTAGLLALCFSRGGSSAAWVQALAAWVQALLTAGAVAAAAWLQDRLLVRREAATRHQRLEGASSIARWCLAVFNKTLERARPQMHPLAFLAVYRPEEFEAAVRALRTIPLADLGDADLAVTVLRLEAAMQTASAALADTTEQVRWKETFVPAEVNGTDLVAKFQTDIFNAAAGVERRVAQLVGRPPLD